MDVRLPDGTIIRNVPEGTTKAQLTEKLAANGFDIGKLQPVETTAARENVAAERAPEWAKNYPQLYKGAVKAREILGPTVEMLGAVGGGALGAGAGTVAGPIGTATGAVGGSALGYGMAKEGLEAVDVALGLKAPRKGAEIVTEPAKNILEGATYEAGGRVVGPIVAKGAQKLGEGVSNVTGKFIDMRQIPKQKAANILRESIGGSVDEVVNALRNAKPGQTPAQALAEAGLNEPVAQALLKSATERDPKFFTDLIKQQDFKTANALAKIAGGETETATRVTMENMKNALNTMTEPQKQMALNRVNLGKEVAEYEKQAGKLSGEAAEQVQKVRDLISAGNAAEAWARLQMIKKNLPVGAARYTFADELAKKAMGQWSDAAAQGSLDAGQMARSFQGASDALRSVGVKPLETKPLVENILAISRVPEFAGNDLIEASVKNVADDLAKWTSVNGIIPGEALDSIRKNSVNAAIRKLMVGADPTTQQQAAASVISKIRPLIVDAIENAGGTGYREYLENYTKGAQQIAARKLSAEARTLFRDSPELFVKLVQGNSPEAVEKIMGKGNYDLALQLSEDALGTLKSAAGQITTRAEAARQATAGEKALVELMSEHTKLLSIPNWFDPRITTANKALDIIENKVGKATLKKLTEAAKTTQSFEELLKTLPASDRNAVLRTIKDPKVWQMIGEKTGKVSEKVLPTKARGGVAAGATNALTTEDENTNALAR